MSRYIDADRLKKHFEWWEGEEKAKEFKEIFDEIIDAQPTADVVEVVRCMDCKHYVKHQLGYGCGMNYRLATNGEWFCADGERRK